MPAQSMGMPEETEAAGTKRQTANVLWSGIADEDEQRTPPWLSLVIPWGLAPGVFAAFSNIVWAVQTRSPYGYAAIIAALGAGLLWWSQWKKGVYSYTAAFLPSYIGACIATSFATYILLIREGTPAWLDISFNLSVVALICAFLGLIFKDPGRIPLPRVSMSSENDSVEDPATRRESDADGSLPRLSNHVSISMDGYGGRENRRGPGRAVESHPSSPRSPTFPYSPPLSAIRPGSRASRMSPLSSTPPKNGAELGRNSRVFELPQRVSDELLERENGFELHRLSDGGLRWGGSNLKGPTGRGTAVDALLSEDEGHDTTPKPRPPYCHICKAAKPPRSKHCPVCDVCIEKFHHHCSAVNNCVGQRNHFLFVVMLLLFILAEYFLDEAAVQFFDRRGSLELPEELTLVSESETLANIERMILVSLLIVGKHPWVSSISFFARIQLLWQVPLLIFHVYCAAVNLTAYEFRNWKKCPDLYVLAPSRSAGAAATRRFVNTHSRGLANNLLAFIRGGEDLRPGF